MYSVNEIIDQIGEAGNAENNLENFVEGNDYEDRSNSEDEGIPKLAKKDDEGSAKKVKKKNVSTRPKLNYDRLRGPRGLICMEKIFSKIQFKGSGHECEDLNAVMNTLQYWCHRLFPKYAFDDTLTELEKLGTKKSIMTLKNKILLDMWDNFDQPVQENEEPVDEEQQEPINDFDLLMQQDTIQTTLPQSSVHNTSKITDEQKETIERNRLLAAERLKARQKKQEENQFNMSVQNESLTTQQVLEITDIQRDIMEKNRLLAIERRNSKQNMTDSQEIQNSQLSQNDFHTFEVTVDIEPISGNFSKALSQNDEIKKAQNDSLISENMLEISTVNSPQKRSENNILFENIQENMRENSLISTLSQIATDNLNIISQNNSKVDQKGAKKLSKDSKIQEDNSEERIENDLEEVTNNNSEIQQKI